MHGARIHASVLMSNHLHLLISTPEQDLGEVMAYFGRSMTRTFNRVSGRTGHLFGGRYHWTLIQSPLHYAYATKYVYRNPVRAGITSTVEQYPYSSLHGLLGLGTLTFPIHYSELEGQGAGSMLYEFDPLLRWLNQPFRKELLEAIDRGFKRKVLELPEAL
jgi:putative transposase